MNPGVVPGRANPNANVPAPSGPQVPTAPTPPTAPGAPNAAMPPGGQIPPGMAPPAATPTPAAPAPAPAAAAPKPAPAPVPMHSGPVVIAVFSEIMTTISTGDAAPKKGETSIEWEKVEAALKRCEGVTGATYDKASKRITATYAGPFAGVDKLRNNVQACGVSSEILSPAKVVFRPMSPVDDDGKVLAALRGISGVNSVAKDFNDYVLFADLSSVELDSITSAANGAGVKGQISTHEMIKITLTSTTGDQTKLMDELGKTKWVLKADIDPASNMVKVLAVRGRVTKALVKSLMTKCGYPEGK